MYSVEAHVPAGATIQTTAKEMTELSQKIQDKVLCMFNEVPIVIEPKHTPEEVIQQYYDLMKEKTGGVDNTPALRAKALGFIQSYAFKGTKQFYTNGSDLVPLFRVRDMLDMMETGDFCYKEA